MKQLTKSKKNYIIAMVVILIAVIIVQYLSLRNSQINYVSHSKEPVIGDKVKNNNPSCKHFESIGTVTKIHSLKGGTGKVVSYKVENNGDTYCTGTMLTKTMDQLAPL